MELYFLIFGVAVWAGALNAVAGGGTFFTFPVLLLTGMSPIIANGTSKVGLWIGAVGSLKAYWPEIKQAKAYLPLMLTVSLVGSVLGTVLLLMISAAQFSAMVPWLLLFATASFAFGPMIRNAMHKDDTPCEVRRGFWPSLLQGIIGTYAGFFGAGIGIYMLALFDWMGLKDIHVMNGLKVAAAVIAHTVSALILIATDTLDWPIAIILMVGAAIGGYGGAYIAKKLPALWIRYFVIIYGFSVTVYFFAK